MNDKLKNKQEIRKLYRDGLEYEGNLDMAEYSQVVLTRERETGGEEQEQERSVSMYDIEVTVHKIKLLMRELDTRKLHGHL